MLWMRLQDNIRAIRFIVEARATGKAVTVFPDGGLYSEPLVACDSCGGSGSVEEWTSPPSRESCRKCDGRGKIPISRVGGDVHWIYRSGGQDVTNALSGDLARAEEREAFLKLVAEYEEEEFRLARAATGSMERDAHEERAIAASDLQIALRRGSLHATK